MGTDITTLECPIDAMYLIHKAMRAQAASVGRVAEEIGVGGSLQAFRSSFGIWASVLLYLFDKEDVFISGLSLDPQHHSDGAAPLTNPGPGSRFKDGGESHRLAQEVRSNMAAASAQDHRQITEKLEEVLAVLNEEIQRTRVIQRTKQHLCQRVLSLRLALDDHIENEETFVLPLVRQRMSNAEQLEVVRQLLVDEQSQVPGWIRNWVTEPLTFGERELLQGLELGIKDSS